MTERYFSRKNSGNHIFNFKNYEVYEKNMDDHVLITSWHDDVQIVILKLDKVGNNIFSVITLYVKQSYRNQNIGSDLIRNFVSKGNVVIFKYNDKIINFLKKFTHLENIDLSVKNDNKFENIYFYEDRFLLWNGGEIVENTEIYIRPKNRQLNELTRNSIGYQNDNEFNHTKNNSRLLPFKLGTFDLTGLVTGDVYHLTLWDENTQVLSMSLSKDEFMGHKVFDVLNVSLRKTYSNRNIGINLYKLLVMKGMNIMSSESQSEGAFKVWNKLANEYGLAVFYFDGSYTRQVDKISESMITNKAKLIATKINSDLYDSLID